MPTRVKNLNGISGKAPPHSGSWLEYWEKESGQTADECAACPNSATIGSAVKKVEGLDDKLYITPLCDFCKRRTDEFNVYFKLVPASLD